MNEIIKRLEEAQTPSRGLDCAIALAVGWHRVEPRHSRSKHGGWISPSDFLGVFSDGKPILDSLHGTTIHRDPPRFTSSLDSALTLIPKGWGFYVRHDDEGAAVALIYPKACPVRPHYHEHKTSPIIALCISALRALNKGETE